MSRGRSILGHGRARWLWAAALAAVLIGIGGAGLVAGPAAAKSNAAQLEGIPRFSHVFVIVLENESYDATWGPSSPATYLNSLRARGTLLTNYYGVGHASNDNYISLTSGQGPNPDAMADCVNWLSCVQAVSSPAYGGGVSLPDQLEARGLSWKGYFGDMPAPCTHATAANTADPYQGDSTNPPGYNYADRHNPFIYYAPIVNNQARCAAHVVPYGQLASDLAAGSAPNYAFIVPNTCDDGHDVPTCADGRPGGLVAADAWLKANVPALLAYVMRHNGLLAITFDEAANTDTSGCCGGGIAGAPGFGGRVGLLALSPNSPAGAQVATPYDHASLLRTVEDAFGIATYLNDANSPNERAMSNIFTSNPR